MEPLVRLSDRVSTLAAWAGGGILFATAVMIAIEVVLRKLFAISMGGADELSNYALAISSLFAGCSLVVSYYAFRVLWTSIERSSIANTPLATPLWIPQGLWFAGILTLTLMVFILLSGTICRLAAGDAAGAQALSGASTIKEEIEEETGSTGERAAGGGPP
ncbi:MAG: hypothetical protein MUD16_17075 [Desulfobacterales bacterium]|nr:hypothetical protein [Desulfobacterales bacterium]